MTTALEHLANAPIDEVACGVVFDAIPKLDPIVVGSYWRERVADFPNHDLRTFIRDAAALMNMFNLVPPLRSMLVSKDDQYVLQIQPDRFYFNWRRRTEGYPRFNSRDGSIGVLGKALGEYEKFAEFCRRTLGGAPQAKSIELAKIDIIREGTYWKTLADVAEMLPCLRDFTAFTRTATPSLALRFSEPRQQGTVQINIALGSQPDKGPRVLTLETRLQRQLGSVDLETAFKESNADLNAVFVGLIPVEARTKYFGQGGKA